MRKVTLVLIICILSLIPVTAYSSDLSLGIGVGDTAFLSAKIDLDRVSSFVLNVGFGPWDNNRLYVRPQLQYIQSRRSFRLERQRLYPYLGIAAPIKVLSKFDLTLSGVLGVSYYIDNGPLEIFLEALPGVKIVRRSEPGLSFDFGASLGVRYSL